MTIRALFVFEGETPESTIVDSLKNNNILLREDLIVTCVFGADIYEVYRKIIEDSAFDTFSLVKERDREALKGHKKDDFYGIYLFFDYDAHATLADDEKIIKMLSVFDEETDNGKLYISYPMSEALWHIEDHSPFCELGVKCKGTANCQYKDDCNEKPECEKRPHYKTIVGRDSIPQLRNISAYNRDTWVRLIIAHLSKMNYLVNDMDKFPDKLESQQIIFTKQFDKHIDKRCPKVAVLSAFPVFVHDYYGNRKTRSLCF